MFCRVTACKKVLDELDRLSRGFLGCVSVVFGRVTCHRWATLLHSCPNAAMHAPGSRKQVLVVVPMSDIRVQVDFPLVQFSLAFNPSK
jgi:hypothetical protein